MFIHRYILSIFVLERNYANVHHVHIITGKKLEASLKENNETSAKIKSIQKSLIK